MKTMWVALAALVVAMLGLWAPALRAAEAAKPAADAKPAAPAPAKVAAPAETTVTGDVVVMKDAAGALHRITIKTDLGKVVVTLDDVGKKLADMLGKKVKVTGTIEEKNGQKTMTATRFEEVK